jgi:uncharacterized membrane protein required for colicin V production
MNLDSLPINAFDFILIVTLFMGIFHGRKLGMSGELLPMLMWLAILFGCAAAYEPLGQFFGQETSLFSTMSCYLMAYIGAAIVILLFFLAIKRAFAGKLLGSDVFGRAEYYLGMGSGLVRVICILLAALALLNARYFNPTEVKAMEKFQDDVYGSNFFPTLHSIQAAVFEKSLTGPWIKQNLGFLLIKPTQPEEKGLHQQDAKY